jgi:hypothetical protein
MNLPLYLPIVFTLTTFLAVFLFSRATSKTLVPKIIVGWLLLQSVISLTGFYTDTRSLPPRFLLLVLPPFLTILALFLTKKGRAFIDSLDTGRLTLLHIVRIPVELVLFWLSVAGTVPKLITFEGDNFDIIAGVTAPLVYYFGYVRPKLSRATLIGWNMVCLALLLNVVVHAILSVDTPFQRFAFDQPNIAVMYFPFVWLPCGIVPLVLFSHLATLRKLFKGC